jgi:hypothetical protein
MTPIDDLDIDERLDGHLRRTLAAVAHTVTEDELVLDPAATGPGAPPVAVLHPHRRTYRRRALLAGAAAAIVAGGLVVARPFGPDETTAWAAEAVAVAEAAPRYLVTADGWSVAGADEFSGARGEMTFADAAGGTELELLWGTGANGGYDDRLEEWTGSDGPLDDLTIAGERADVFLSGSPDQPHFVAVWESGDHGVEVRGDFPDLAAFQAVTATIEPVGVDAWLEAMPPGVVRAQTREAAVQQMLADIPLPTGFDADELAVGDGAVADRYQLGAEVTGAVACAWIGQWVEATGAGDTAAAAEAVDAMATSPEWDVLVEMEPQGAWAPAVWELAEAIATDGTVDGGVPDIPVADTYAESLGCDAG